MHIIKEFLTRYENELGYKIPAAGKEAKGAKRIIDMGFGIDEAMSCYRYFKTQPFWSGKHLSLTYIAGNISAWSLGRVSKDADYDDDALKQWYEDHNNGK